MRHRINKYLLAQHHVTRNNSTYLLPVIVAHRVFGVASAINSGNYVYFIAMERTLKLQHPEAMTIFTSELLNYNHCMNLISASIFLS